MQGFPLSDHCWSTPEQESAGERETSVSVREKESTVGSEAKPIFTETLYMVLVKMQNLDFKQTFEISEVNRCCSRRVRTLTSEISTAGPRCTGPR